MQEPKTEGTELRSIIRGVIEEFVQAEQAKAEPAYKAELLDERKRREDLEKRVNELVQENHRSRKMAEEADRGSSIRAELQRLGVAKVDLAYRVIKDDIQRSEDGRLTARSSEGEVPLKEYLAQFVQENPELLPARITGGSGMGSGPKMAPNMGGLDLDKIRPGMSPEELEKVRQEISRVANQALRGF
jgi:ATP/maltotriose-dependent transcriptional regulator MalT